MSFFGGMPQYYDMGNDPLNQRDIFNETSRMHLGDARYLQKMDGRAQVGFGLDAGPQQGPRMHNPLMDGVRKDHYQREVLPRETAGLRYLQDQHRDIDQVRNQQNVQDIIFGGQQEILESRSGRVAETPDLAIVREIMQRRRR